VNEIEKLKEIIKSSKRIVFFGGAGVSTESGIIIQSTFIIFILIK